MVASEKKEVSVCDKGEVFCLVDRVCVIAALYNGKREIET